MPETLIEKALRHVQSGQFDTNTLQRGSQQILELLRNWREEEGRLLTPQIYTSYLGIYDLNAYFYKLIIPKTPVVSVFDRERRPYVDIRVIGFPRVARFQTLITASDEPTKFTGDIFKETRGAIAYFTGPTHNAHDQKIPGLPNNGFYSKSSKDQIEFGVVPFGERRGAFGVRTDDAKIDIFSDQKKMQVIADGFANYDSLIGCSYFFDGKDAVTDHSEEVSKGKGNLSYLVTMVYADGSNRTYFTVTDSMIRRSTMQKVITDVCSRTNAVKFRAVELELTGSAYGLRNPKNEKEYLGTGFYSRRDHYLVF